MLTKPTDMYSIVYNSFIIVGGVLSIISLFIDSKTAAPLSITAYTCITLGVVLIMCTLINNLNLNIGNISDLFTALKLNIGPFILMTLTLVYLLYLTIAYRKRIESGEISDSYYTFNNITILLIGIQIILIYAGMDRPSFKSQGVIPLMYSSFIYLVGFINIIFAFTLGVILSYFTTDG